MSIITRLLLATEDIALARTLSWVLKENGYDVVTATDGMQLTSRLEQEEYDLLAFDIGSGGSVNFARLESVREHPDHKSTPLLVLADQAFPPEALEPFGLGITDVVHRPYRVRELLARMKAHLRVGRELNQARAEARSRSELVTILKEVTAAMEPSEIFQILVRRVAQGLRIARCSVVLAKPGDPEGTVVAAFENPTIRDLKVDLARYPEIREALANGETVLVDDVSEHPLYEDVRQSWSTDMQQSATRSVIAMPFEVQGRTGGVFFLRTTSDDPPLNQIDLGFAEQVIEAAMTALNKAYDVRDQQGGAELRELADSDPLTGIPNRRVFDNRVQDEIDRANRYDQVVTVVLIDIDDFKGVNDTYGHQVGDTILKQLALLLKRELRTMDFLARIGGEEFVIILPETGGTGARLFTDRMLRRVAQHQFGDSESTVAMTASAGLATFPDDRVADRESLMKLADENLYRAKDAGRNRYRD